MVDKYRRHIVAYADYFKNFRKTLPKKDLAKLYHVFLYIMTLDRIPIKYFKAVTSVRARSSPPRSRQPARPLARARSIASRSRRMTTGRAPSTAVRRSGVTSRSTPLMKRRAWSRSCVSFICRPTGVRDCSQMRLKTGLISKASSLLGLVSALCLNESCRFESAAHSGASSSSSVL